MKKREQYYKMIWIYYKRRELLKEQFGNRSGKTKHLTKKISQWKNQIRRIDARNKKLKQIIKFINNFFDVKIESLSMDKQHKLARMVYYKYAMEQKIQGVFVGNMINRKGKHTAADGRLIFTRSFKNNLPNRNIYHQFLKSLK